MISSPTGPQRPPDPIWLDEQQAEHYQRFTAGFPYYRLAASALVEAAELGPGERVVDLACGTGVSTDVCLQRVGSEGRVVGVDPSAAALSIAARSLCPERVRLLQGSVPATVSAFGAGAADCVVCASAVWLFGPPQQWLSTVVEALRPDGRFAFSVPAELLGDCDHMLGPGAVALWGSVAAARAHLGLAAALALPPGERPPDLPGWRLALAAAGLPTVVARRWSAPSTVGEWRAQLGMPVMLRSLLPTACASERAAFLAELDRRIDPALPVERVWYLVVARRHGASVEASQRESECDTS